MKIYEKIDAISVIQKEMIEGKGEDSFCSSCNDSSAFIAVFDGCGGSGGRTYPQMANHTGAYLASRLMSGSLYEISNELRNILNSAMENDGTITQEEFDRLNITEENFSQKVEDYCKAIAVSKYDIDNCKCEKKRINTNQQVIVNFTEKLKARLLEAVIEFGQEKEGKNGTTYTMNAGTFKLFTKNLVKFIEDEYRTNLLKNTLLSYFKELFINGVLIADNFKEESNSDDEVSAMLGAVNAIAKSRFEADVENNVAPPLPTTEWVDFTVEDLKALTFSFSFEITAKDLITDGTYIAQAYSNFFGLRDVNATVVPVSGDEENITLGQNQINQSLTIK